MRWTHVRIRVDVLDAGAPEKRIPPLARASVARARYARRGRSVGDVANIADLAAASEAGREEGSVARTDLASRGSLSEGGRVQKSSTHQLKASVAVFRQMRAT